MKTNQELKLANLPRCNWRDFLKFTGMGEPPAEMVAQLDHYFSHFVYERSPAGIVICIKCGHQQGVDDRMDVLGKIGRFRFGMQHGEGICMTGGCGWPARAIHYNIGPLKSLEMILQWHPDVVRFE